MTLTRNDKVTGQRLYDYHMTVVADPEGKFLRPLAEGGFFRYSLVKTITRRYQII